MEEEEMLVPLDSLPGRPVAPVSRLDVVDAQTDDVLVLAARSVVEEQDRPKASLRYDPRGLSSAGPRVRLDVRRLDPPVAFCQGQRERRREGEEAIEDASPSQLGRGGRHWLARAALGEERSDLCVLRLGSLAVR